MALLTIADGALKLGDKEIDGILKSVNVGCEVVFDEEKRDGLSGSVKVPRGWSDGDVNIVLELVTDEGGEGKTCYDRLTELDAIFKQRNKAPLVYDVTNRHLSARGIRRIAFSKLDSSETSEDDVIAVTLQFKEDKPAIVKAEKGQSSKGGADVKTGEEAKPEASLLIDVK